MTPNETYAASKVAPSVLGALKDAAAKGESVSYTDLENKVGSGTTHIGRALRFLEAAGEIRIHRNPPFASIYEIVATGQKTAPRERVRQEKRSTEKIKRKCLRCRGTFKADGRFNRLCPKCKSYADHVGDDYGLSGSGGGRVAPKEAA